MSTGEILLTLLITVIVFKPSKWPMLAHHLAKGVRAIQRYKQHAQRFWQEQLDVYQFEENKKKAAAADRRYDAN